MPTGYTADVADGKITDLRSFALQCARGMGALIMMRDEPWDAPIPERFEPSDFYAKHLQEAKAERQRIYNMTDAEADAAAAAEFDEKEAREAKWRADRAEQRARYQAMIDLVEPWQRAPEGLKEFMLEQLRTGMEFDCPAEGTFYDEPKRRSGSEWRAEKLERVGRDILRYAEEDAKERARTDARNAWIAQLRAALTPEMENA